jgi:hypothetical protein
MTLIGRLVPRVKIHDNIKVREINKSPEGGGRMAKGSKCPLCKQYTLQPDPGAPKKQAEVFERLRKLREKVS